MLRKQQGMTFIEVLIALFILVTGILGAVALQASVKKGSFDAMQRSLASSLAQDMLERMRSNNATLAGSVLNNYAGTNYGSGALAAPSVRCDAIGNICSPAQRVTNDLYEWEQALMGADVKSADDGNVGGLNGARGCIAEANNAVTIAISWEGRTETSDGAADSSVKCGTGSNKRRQLVIEAFIFN